ncbi:unnamed protein product [Durusdinium trenchii]|uniref:Uncharacterized protein n=1 Tax=Durusdinium trenchii TaxID=1381693 RepID=A0ABP0H7I1_9DINO
MIQPSTKGTRPNRRAMVRSCLLLPWILPNLARGSQTLEWLFDMGGGQQVFPLMDFVASESQEIDAFLEQQRQRLVMPGSSLTQIHDEAAHVRHQSAAANEVALADWLLQIHWSSLLDSDLGRGILAELSAVTPQIESSPCDAASYDVDDVFLERLERSLQGIETLPLEQNEFKWADFFGRKITQQPLCLVGVATLFLVAADITAFASAAEGGEHQMRLERALLFAQSLVRQHVEEAPPGQIDRHRRDLFRSCWPIWRLMRSIQKELDAGHEFRAPQNAALDTPQQETEDLLYLTVIVQCRNDDYGGNMLLRLNRMLATTTRMLHTTQVPSEIIVVEWNPVFNAAAIHEEIQREAGAESVPIRVIQVPTSVHMSMPHHKAHPIFEHTAENVAFRRARGKFILKTNIDNILSPDTILFIARQQLDPNVVYRATYMEYDVTCPEAEGLKADELVEWLFSREEMISGMNMEMADLRLKYPEDALVCTEGRFVPDAPQRPFYWAGSGDFVLASKQKIMEVRGYPEVAQNWQTDDMIHCRLRAAGVRQVVLQPPCVTVHQNHRRINRVRASTRWVITDKNFQEVCENPFKPLKTEIDSHWASFGPST